MGHNYCRHLVCSELRPSAQRATNRPEPSRSRLSANSWLVTRVTLSMTWPDLTCLSMDVRDCIGYKNTLKHFIHLRSNSRSVTARCTTWNPANWYENQMEIRSKTLLIPAHTRRLITSCCQSRCTALWSHARATLGWTIIGCVHSHEINRLQHCLGWVCSYTLASLTPDSVVTYIYCCAAAAAANTITTITTTIKATQIED